mmetsp:Transcript_22300/g.46356  ORF Transcript_22300/g.46356 Transcript_22300/m.46356 type:complete len:99 (-) Transcript_22300:84-380(-)
MAEISGDDMWAMAKVLREKCTVQALNVSQCKLLSSDPAACATQSEEAQRCLTVVHAAALSSCNDTYTAYRDCLVEKRGIFSKCRDVEAKFKECAQAKI